jgi:hypothetical protein
MALTLTKDAPNFPFSVVAKDSEGNLGAALPVGAAGVKVTANPEGVAVVSLDPNPVPVNNPFDPYTGTKSVSSGVVNPMEVGNSTITAAILNPDGTSLAEITDTVSVVDPAPGVAPWAGTLFGAGAPIALPAPGTAAKAAAPTPIHHNASSTHSHEEEKKRK